MRIRTGRASRLGRSIRCVFCFVFCVVFCVVFCFYSLADSRERRKPRRTGHSGVRGGQDKGFVLKLSWPSTAEYRMKKFKKKKKTLRYPHIAHRCAPAPMLRETGVLYLLLSPHGRRHTNVIAESNTAVLRQDFLGQLGLRSTLPRPHSDRSLHARMHYDASKSLVTAVLRFALDDLQHSVQAYTLFRTLWWLACLSSNIVLWLPLRHDVSDHRTSLVSIRGSTVVWYSGEECIV